TYATAVGLSGRADAWAPAVAAALVVVWDTSPAAAELLRPAAVERGLARAWAVRTTGLAAGAAAIGWLALVPGRAGSAGGVALTGAGALAGVLALLIAVGLARR